LVGFFYVYFCGCFTPYTKLSTHQGILHEVNYVHRQKILRWNKTRIALEIAWSLGGAAPAAK
jgi:hypothetical protein